MVDTTFYVYGIEQEEIMTIENQELLNKAKELEIEVKDDMEEKDLEDSIFAKEKEIEDTKEKEKDPEYLKSELEKMKAEAKKAFETRDNVKKERRTLQNKIKDMEDKLAERPEIDEYNEMKKTLDELQAFKKQKEEEEEEKALENKSELEKAQARHQKEMDNFQKQLDELTTSMKAKEQEHQSILAEKDKELERQRKRDLGVQIREAAEKSKAYNPKQIEKLLKDEFEYNKELDSWERFYKDDRGRDNTQTIEERVSEFLSDPDNENLVEADTKGGTGTRDSDIPPSNDKKKKEDFADTFNKENEKERLKRIAEEKDLSVEQVKEIEDRKKEIFANKQSK